MKQKALTLLGSFLLLLLTQGAQARHLRRSDAPAAPARFYSWEDESPVSSPVLVQDFTLPTTADPKEALFLRKMHLENGVDVKATRWITKDDVGSRDLFILDITQSLEGGFDSVNIYDRGILSWGIMQWSARSGSLTNALVYIKRRLMATHRTRLWKKLFVANGIDADPAGLILFGKPMTTPQMLRVGIRGTMKIGSDDPKLVAHWATVMAQAGRDPAVASLEVAYAGQIVDAALKKRLEGLPYHAPGRRGLTTEDLTANDPYAEALVFALWTNNPTHAFDYVEQAARAARAVSGSNDPALWKPGAFSSALLRLCSGSRFGNWSQRAALIEARAETVRTAAPSQLTPFEQKYQVVLAERKAIHSLDLAERETEKLTRRHAVEQAATRVASQPAQYE
jgi:hypothetical protein